MIYNFIAYAPRDHEMDLAWTYNYYMSLLPNDDDWACFIDHDAMFTTPDWYSQVEKIIEKNPEYSCFTAVTNRCYAQWQIPQDIDRENHDIKYHRGIGLSMQMTERLRVADVTKCADLPAPPPSSPLSGVVIIYKKSAWKKVPFRLMEPGRFTGIDNLLHLDLRDNGFKIGLMCGVYVYHWHRAVPQQQEDVTEQGLEWVDRRRFAKIKEDEEVGMEIEAARQKIKDNKEDNFVIIGVPLPYTRSIDLLTCLWVEYQKRKENMMALYESSRWASHGRNNVIYKTLQYLPGATHIFFIDRDVVPPVDAIERLMDHDKDVVVGVTPIYKEQPCWSVMKYDPEETIDNIFKPIPYNDLPDKLFRAHHFGATTVLIKRHVFEKMGYPWYQDLFAPGSLLLGQDLFFTAKAKRYGFELWCDPTIECEHIRQSEMKTVFDKCLRDKSPQLKEIVNV
jgi:GT2 family glycosyltransferase